MKSHLSKISIFLITKDSYNHLEQDVETKKMHACSTYLLIAFGLSATSATLFGQPSTFDQLKKQQDLFEQFKLSQQRPTNHIFSHHQSHT